MRPGDNGDSLTHNWEISIMEYGEGMMLWNNIYNRNWWQEY